MIKGILFPYFFYPFCCSKSTRLVFPSNLTVFLFSPLPTEPFFTFFITVHFFFLRIPVVLSDGLVREAVGHDRLCVLHARYCSRSVECSTDGGRVFRVCGLTVRGNGNKSNFFGFPEWPLGNLLAI